MSIQRGDFVRPNNPNAGLPTDSVWRVVFVTGDKLELTPKNATASYIATVGRRFTAAHFDKVVWWRGKWAAVNDSLSEPSGIDPFATCLKNLPKAQTSAVANAETNLTDATSAAAAIEGMLEAARKLEAKRKAEVHAAKLAKAKADKAAAARAKAEEAKRQLAARLHADRYLGEATLALIAEVSRLNNGGADQVASSSIAAHIDQLQALAKSYGYRIAKPSMLAVVVKL